jgi:hypothetical protein
MPVSPHEFMGWVVLTLVFILAGNFAALGGAMLMKLEKESLATVKVAMKLMALGTLVALLFALVGLAICR